MTEPRPPKWEVIAAEFRAQIADGTYAPGDTLPEAKGHAERIGVHHETVRAAYRALEEEGLIRRIKRRGSVVLGAHERRRITRGVHVMRDPERGYVFPAASRADEPWQVHGQPYRSTVPAPVEVTEAFDLPPDTSVLRRRRVTSPAGESPFQLVDTWISPTGVNDAPQVAEPSTGPGGYLDRLEEAGHGPIEWQETVRAGRPTRDEAKLLEIAPSMPVLRTVIIGTSARTQRPIEVTIRVIPSSRVELVSKLQRTGRARWPVEPVTDV